MSTIKNIIEYPEEGFAILEDDAGKFVAFREDDRIEELPQGSEFNPSMYLKHLGSTQSVAQVFDRVY